MASVFDSGALLAAPRGRRLCLALAMALDEDVRWAAFHAAYALDPGAGTSRVMFGWGDGAAVPNPVSAADVAARIEVARWPAPTESDLMGALDETVSNARYWQEPDGEDVLAATPAVREALRPLADMVLASPLAAWWSTPAERGAQRFVVWHRDGTPDVVRAGGVAELDAWHVRTVAEEAAARRDRPQDAAANISGTWWSTPTVAPRTTRELVGQGPVGLRLVEDSAGWESATVHTVPVADGVHVVEIDGPDAWADLCRRHPLDVTASRCHDWYRATGRDSGSWVQPDWAALARHVDGVHVSVAGYLLTAGSIVPVADGVASVMAGWDPDATLWLTGLPTGGGRKSVGHAWVLDRDAARWRPRGQDVPGTVHRVDEPLIVETLSRDDEG